MRVQLETDGTCSHGTKATFESCTNRLASNAGWMSNRGTNATGCTWECRSGYSENCGGTGCDACTVASLCAHGKYLNGTCSHSTKRHVSRVRTGLPSKNIANYKKTLNRADVVKKRVDEGLVMVLEEVSHVANRTVSGSGVCGVVSTLADARTEAADLMGRMVSSAEDRSPPQARVDVTREGRPIG